MGFHQDDPFALRTPLKATAASGRRIRIASSLFGFRGLIRPSGRQWICDPAPRIFCASPTVMVCRSMSLCSNYFCLASHQLCTTRTFDRCFSPRYSNGGILATLGTGDGDFFASVFPVPCEGMALSALVGDRVGLPIVAAMRSFAMALVNRFV